MAVLVGIDEAGYGPILGPLVVSAAAFEIPDDLLTNSMWDVLRRSVCKKLAGNAGRLAINDSKKLHGGLGKYEHLQRAALTCLKTLTPHTPPPQTLGQLLAALQADCLGTFPQYPWYNGRAAGWPLRYDSDSIAGSANALTGDLHDHQMRLLALWSCPLEVAQYNQMVEAVDNKASVLFSQTSNLLFRAYQQFGRQNLHIVIDKQGGRSHYRQNLQRLFPHLPLKILKENDTCSSYQMADASHSFKVHFIVKGDDRQLPVALASMVSKYVRELFMELVNEYFHKHCPQLQPTAGYYTDGHRFLNDLKTLQLDPALYPLHLLLRQR